MYTWEDNMVRSSYRCRKLCLDSRDGLAMAHEVFHPPEQKPNKDADSFIVKNPTKVPDQKLGPGLLGEGAKFGSWTNI